jgi:DNA-binding CsgD family transcriptional regulator
MPGGAAPKATDVDSLTPRQRACLRGVWDRQRVDAVAANLGISPRTVEEHLRAARERLGATSSLDAARITAIALGWSEVRVEPLPGATRVPDAASDPLAWPVPDAPHQADTASVDHQLGVGSRWLAAVARAAAIAVAGLVALLALSATLDLLSRRLQGPHSTNPPARPAGRSQMSKSRQDARSGVARRVAERLFEAEGLADDSLASIGGMLAELPKLRRDAQLSATFGQEVFVELAAAQQAMVAVRGHLVDAHHRLAECRDQLKVDVEVPPVLDKPPPNAVLPPDLRLVG